MIIWRKRYAPFPNVVTVATSSAPRIIQQVSRSHREVVQNRRRFCLAGPERWGLRSLCAGCQPRTVKPGMVRPTHQALMAVEQYSSWSDQKSAIGAKQWLRRQPFASASGAFLSSRGSDLPTRVWTSLPGRPRARKTKPCLMLPDYAISRKTHLPSGGTNVVCLPPVSITPSEPNCELHHGKP